MSYWPKQYGDPETVENIHYEKRQPQWFDKYFDETSGPEVQSTPSPNEQETPWFEKYFQEEPVDDRGLLEKGINKAGRLVAQGAIGAIQRQTAPFDIPVMAAQALARNPLIESVERAEQGEPELTQEIQRQQPSHIRELEGKFKNALKEQDVMRKKSSLSNFVQNQGLDVGSLIESGAKQFGIDLSPQGIDEMALRWTGFIKNPSKAQELMKAGLNSANLKEIGKALLPTGKEAARGIGAALALDYAAEAELGPIGSMAAAVIGDIAPTIAFSGAKQAAQFATNPIKTTKKGLAKAVAAFTPKNKQELQQKIIQEFRDAGIQADVGTVSGSNLIKWVQNSLSQSGLTGAPLEEFRKTLTNNIVNEYKNIASALGESAYESRYEAGEALKNGLQEARDVDLASARELYNSAKERAGQSQVFTGNIGEAIQKLENELEPGSLKSPEQQKVIEVLNTVKKDVLTPEGTIKGASIRSLTNNKIALNDLIDYEVQGGAKKLLGQLVGEIEKAIVSHGKVDPAFAREWQQANAKFAQHAKTFRGKTISNALRTQDPSLIFSKMNTPHGIEEIRKALNVTPEGRELFKELSRYKLEELIGKNMVDGTTNQLKFGTFSNLLAKNQNRQVVKSLLGSENLRKLEAIQKASGRLAETAQKFLNSSRSGVHAGDLAYAAKILHDVGHIFAGNPWPLVKSIGGLLAARQVARYFSDPEFIQMLEDVVLAQRQGSETALQRAASRLVQKAKTLQEPGIAALENAPTSSE